MSEIENLKELRIKYLSGNRRTKDQILTSLCLVHGGQPQERYPCNVHGIKASAGVETKEEAKA